jgi:plastocyanin
VTRVTAVALAVAGLLVAACGDGAPAPTGGSPSGSSPTVERTLVAHDIEFEPTELHIPTGTTLLVAFDNADPGVPHGLVLYADPAGTIRLAEAPIVVGPDHAVVEIAPLVVGRYRFSCVVHPNMNAVLVVDPR